MLGGTGSNRHEVCPIFEVLAVTTLKIVFWIYHSLLERFTSLHGLTSQNSNLHYLYQYSLNVTCFLDVVVVVV
jgi:hypothetical protein